MMKVKYLALVLVVLFAGSVTFGAMTLEMNGSPVFTIPQGGDVLYSQLDDPSGYVFTDQEFEAAYAAYNSEGADDFDVTDSPGWDITVLNTPGLQTAGGTPFFTNHFFYGDGGTGPGAVLEGCSYPASTNFVHDLGNISATVPCNVDTGINWFSQQVRQDFVPFGQHFWATRMNNNYSPGNWRNPGNGFGNGCLDWTPGNEFCGMNGKDWQFELLGTIREPPSTPAVGPFGIALMILGLGAGSAYVLRRR